MNFAKFFERISAVDVSVTSEIKTITKKHRLLLSCLTWTIFCQLGKRSY